MQQKPIICTLRNAVFNFTPKANFFHIPPWKMGMVWITVDVSSHYLIVDRKTSETRVYTAHWCVCF